MKKFFLFVVSFFCFSQYLLCSSEALYRNNLKNRDFGEEAHQNLDSERATIAKRQGASENQNCDEKPTSPKTDSSGCFGIASHQTIRAAFDLGSGSFKILVCEMDGDLVKCRFSRVISVELGFDLAASTDMKFSPNGWQNALDSLRSLVDDARQEGATQFAGVATAAFRRAKNGPELLEYLNDQLGVNLQLISQEEEGILGFETAMTLFPEFSKQNSLVLDLGSGSFQITTYDKNGYTAFHSQVGVSQIVKQFFEEIRKTPYSRETPFTPITAEEVALVMKLLDSQISFPVWLKTKSLEGAPLVMCNDAIPQFQSDSGKQDIITKDDLKHILFDLPDYKNPLEPQKRLAFTIAYTFLYKILSDLDLNQFAVKEVSSGCAAGFIKDESFWSNYTSTQMNPKIGNLAKPMPQT